MAADERRLTLIKNKGLIRVHQRSSAAKIVISSFSAAAEACATAKRGFQTLPSRGLARLQE
jgi:hypothetical protein